MLGSHVSPLCPVNSHSFFRLPLQTVLPERSCPQLSRLEDVFIYTLYWGAPGSASGSMLCWKLRKPRSCYTRGYSLLEQNTSSISRGRKSMRQSPEETRQEFPRSCSSWSPRGHAWTGTSGFRQGAVIWSYDAHVTDLSHWSSRPSEEKQVFIISRVVHRNSAVSSMQQDPQHGRNYQNISRAGFSEANLENLCHRIGPSREGNVRGVSKLARWVNPFYPHIHTCVCMYTYLFIMVQNCQPSIYFAQLIFIIL